MQTLEITKRDTSAKNDALRAQGKLPGVYYGRKEKSTPILVDEKKFTKMFKEAGESTVIGLKDDAHTVDALIKDVQVDPITDRIIHVDFYALEKGKKVTVSVPFTYVGIAPAVKDLGGTLVKVMHEVEIEALPKDLIHSLEVDISSLVDFDAQIQIKDLKVPAGVEILAEENEVVALAEPAHEEVEEAPVAAPDFSAIEVEKKGKKDEEGGESEGSPKSE